MRSSIIAVFLLSLFTGNLLAQKVDSALIAISYEFVFVNDTNNRNNPRKEEMIAYLGQSSYVFRPGKSSTISPWRGDDLYILPKENSAVKSEYLSNVGYMMESTLSPIDWVVGDVIKEIGDYRCQQAKGSFGGRDYTVWFATELPSPFGPWKLHGLPGLILQAEDSKKEVFFNFIDFEKVGELAISVIPPTDLKKTTEQDFKKAKDLYAINPHITDDANVSVTYYGKDSKGNGTIVSKEEYEKSNRERLNKQAALNNNSLELE